MSLLGCNFKCNCTAAAVIVSAIVGVIAAFLQITGVITVTAAFLAILFGIAIVYLGVLLVAVALTRRAEQGVCACASLNALLIGILGTIAFAVILLAVGIVATSVLSAILVGLLLFFFALTLTATACFIRSHVDCETQS